MKVADIMTLNPVTVNGNSSLQDAAGILAKLRIHGMPVVDENNKVIGIITESDFFVKDSSNIYLPTFLDFVKTDKSELSGKKFAEDLEKKTTVADIMTTDCITVGPDMSLEELILLIKDKNFNSIPVVNKEGILQGIVTIIDVIRLL